MSPWTAIAAFAHRAARPAARAQLLAYSGGIAVGMVLLAAWVCARAEEPPGGTCMWEFCPTAWPMVAWSVLALADLFAVGALAFALLVIAPAAVAAAVAAERRAGTLDQLRTTPLSPLGLVAGIVAGGPIQIYLLCAGPLALHLACGVVGAVPADTVVASLGVLFAGGCASVLIGLAVALAPRQETGGALIALGVATVLGLGGFVTGAFATHDEPARWSFLFPGGALHAAYLHHDGIWRRLMMSPWRLDRFSDGDYVATLAATPALSVACALALAALVGAACCRKLAAPDRPLLSKRMAIALFAGLAAAVALPAGGVVRSARDAAEVSLVCAFVLLPIAIFLGAFASPTGDAWARALRRGARPSWTSDDAPAHGAMWIMVALLAALLALGVGPGRLADAPERFALALAWTFAVALTLPVFVHFGLTRFSTAAARWGWAATIFVHLAAQVTAIVLVMDRHGDWLFVQVAAVLSALAPSLTLIAQRALRRRVLAG